MFLTSSFALLALFVVLVLDNKELFDPTYILKVRYESGLGLKPGTEVQVNGVQVGKVKSIMLNDDRQVELELEIKEVYQHFITTESVAYPTRDKNIISDRVIFISPGAKGRILKNNEVLSSEDPKDIESLLSQTRELLDKVQFLVYAGDTLIKMARDPNSTVGALLQSRTLHDNLVKQTQIIDKITSKSLLLIDTIQRYTPQLLGQLDTIQKSVIELSGKGTRTFGKIDTLLDISIEMTQTAGPMIYQAQDLLNASEDKVDQAGHLMKEVNDLWFFDDPPDHSKIPYLTEGQW